MTNSRPLAGLLTGPHTIAMPLRSFLLHTPVRRE